jgi:hypothetical protein
MPFGTRFQTGNAIYKRLQVKNADLEPDLNPGATYFVEATYLFPDDAPLPDGLPDGPDANTIDDYDQQDDSYNNSSHRRITITESPANQYNVAFAGPTVRELPAIYAWQTADPGVLIKDAVVEGDGRFFVGSRATPNGDGTWHYEYAVMNHTSNRAASSFSVPIPYGANVTNIGFHDVDYHSQNTNGSGSFYEGTDWTDNGAAGFSVTWTMPEEVTPGRGNALRWLTLYNFRFDADVPPADAAATIGLYLPGTPSELQPRVVAPSPCDADLVCDPSETSANCADCVNQSGGGGTCGDGTCNAGEGPCTCLRDCGDATVEEFLCTNGDDDDCDGLVDCADADCCADASCNGADPDGDGFDLCDCNNANPNVWTPPGEVEALVLDTVAGSTTLSWDEPIEPGATLVTYEAIRSQNRTNFMTSTACLADGDPTDTTVTDATSPGAGVTFYYEVHAQNACPAGEGPLGRDSHNIPREGRSCP